MTSEPTQPQAVSEPTNQNDGNLPEEADQLVKLSLEIGLEAFCVRVEEALTNARREAVTGDTSDGYHTFNELYEFRKLYNAALFNEWANQGKYNVHKSTRHHDGEACFGGGWFIVMATLPTGQISNHYEMKDWDLFKCDMFTKAEEWDGHTARDVVKRLSDYLNQEAQSSEEKVI